MLTQATGNQALVVQCQLVLLPLQSDTIVPSKARCSVSLLVLDACIANRCRVPRADQDAKDKYAAARAAAQALPKKVIKSCRGIESPLCIETYVNCISAALYQQPVR